jgi:hypothetical protein
MDELVHHISKDNTAEENRAAPGEALGDCTVAAQPKKEKSLVKNQTFDSCQRWIHHERRAQTLESNLSSSDGLPGGEEKTRQANRQLLAAAHRQNEATEEIMNGGLAQWTGHE